MTRKLALITGGTSGIGFATAQHLANEYDLALNFASNQEKADEAYQQLKQNSPNTRVELFKQTLSTPADCENLYKSVQERFQNTPALLINSAGRLHDGLLMQQDFESYRKVIDEHLIATLALSQLALKAMYRAKFGRIVILSSISSFYAKRGQSNYAAAKAGLEGFARTLALEVAHRGITVNCVAPGLIATPMTQDLISKIESTGDLRKRIPCGRLGEAREVGALIHFLCSEAAAYITGTVIPIDGGRSLGDPQS